MGFLMTSVHRELFWALVGNIGYALCQWGALVLLAHIGTTEMLGEFTLALAISAPVFLLTGLSLRTLLTADVGFRIPFASYFSVRVLTSLLALLISIAISIVFRFGGEIILLTLLLSIGKVIDGLCELYYAVLQQSRRQDLIARALITNGTLSMTTLGVGILVTGDLIWGSLGWIFASAFTLIFVVWKLAPSTFLRLGIGPIFPILEMRPHRFLSGGSQIEQQRGLIRLAFPLGASAAISSLSVNIPRYFLAFYAGQANLGIFAAIGYAIVAGNTVVSSLAQISLPRLARFYVEGNRYQFTRLCKQLCLSGFGFGILFALLAILLGERALDIVYGAEYAKQSASLVIFGIGLSFGACAWLLSYALTAMQQLRKQLWASITSVAVLGLASFMLIPGLGVLGASIAVSISAIVQTTVLLCVAIRAVPDSFPEPVISTAIST
jgi:O-antigen/teichoic acid export membrane protein